MGVDSKDQQVKHIVEGLALGVLAQGVEAVTSSRMEFEFAFNRAWRSWPRAKDFPGIAGHDPGNLFWIGVGKSERRRVVSAAWNRDRWAEPYISHENWTVSDCLDLHADERASAEDWTELGRLYVAGFKPEHVRHTI